MRILGAALLLAVAALWPSAAIAQAPVVGREIARGDVTIRAVAPDAKSGALVRRADGDLRDWRGESSGYAGTTHYSHGEYVYEDHLWDAFGAMGDDGSARAAALDALASGDPELYRAEAAALYLPTGTQYGSGPLDLAADLTEFRVATSGRKDVAVLARTTLMTAGEQPAVLLLADTRPGETSRAIPFGSALGSTRADIAILLTPGGGTAVDLASGRKRPVPVAAVSDGYENALEAVLPRDLVADAGRFRIAAAAGRLDPTSGELAARAAGPAIANVAFRREPVRPKFDKLQAQHLHESTIDPFFTTIDLARLEAGATESVTPGAGYHDRVFRSSETYSRERGTDGVLQRYGVYVPAGVSLQDPSPATFFLHGSGNDAHDLPIVMPGLARALGDQRGSIVLAPKGRTGFSLWLGAGLADVLEMWADARRAFPLDDRRTVMTGYSMGGIGAYLISSLMPDRFAASFVVAGPVGGDVASPGVGTRSLPDVRRLFANLRWVPTLVYSGGADNNVPLTNGLAAADALGALGYRHRLYAFPGDNHFSPGVVDRWDEAVAYLSAFSRVDPDPPRVSYVRDMAFERMVNRGEMSDQEIVPEAGHGFRFDRAYWLSGLVAADPANGVAHVDAASLAIPQTPVETVAENGAGGSPNPYSWRGLRWAMAGEAPAVENALTLRARGASALRLDAARMRLDPDARLTARVDTDPPLAVGLAGDWGPRAPTATIDGAPLRVAVVKGGLRIAVPAGAHDIAIDAARRCLPRSARLSGRGLGELRLGRSASTLVRRAGPPASRTRRRMRYCAESGGRVSIMLAGTRAALVVSTAPAHRAGRVGPRISARRLRTLWPRMRRVAPGLFRRHPRSRIVARVSRGRVRYVAVADSRRAASGAALVRALRGLA
jgi:poly(3-hydroxybutyrate) depolymerase